MGFHQLVGRERELLRIERALSEAKSGRTRIVVLSGEPGIGKSSLAQAAVRTCADSGTFALAGRCYNPEIVPPYWPWIKAIRGYVESHDVAAIRKHIANGLSDIARLVPELLDITDGEASEADLEPHQVRFRIFSGITNFLRKFSESQTILLFIDDLHLADEASLRTLEFVAHELDASRICIITTYRTTGITEDHGFAATLSELARADGYEEIALKGIERKDTSALIEARAGYAPPDEFIDLILSQTDGNPLYVTEIIKLIQDRNTAQSDHQTEWMYDDLPIPESIRHTIRGRIELLPSRCQSQLMVASVIGPVFELGFLQTVLSGGIPDSGTESISDIDLDAMVNAGILDRVDNVAETFRFSHGLIHEVVKSLVPAIRYRTVSARIAEVLELRYESGAKDHAEEIAVHLSNAGDPKLRNKLVEYSTFAGEAALERHSYEKAIEHFETALGNCSHDAGDDTIPRIWTGLGQAHVVAGETKIGIEYLEMAFSYYESAGDIENMVHVAARQLYLHQGDHASADWIERAMKAVEPGTREYAVLLSSAAVSALESGDAARAATLAEYAIKESNRVGDIKAKMYAFIAAGVVEYRRLRFLTSFKYAKMAQELAVAIRDLPSEVCALNLLINGYNAVGDREAVRTALQQMLETAELLRDRFWLRIALYYISRIHILAGRWSDALDASFRSSKLVNAPLWRQREYLWVMHECGKYDEVIDKLDIIASEFPDSHGKPWTLMSWWMFLPKLARIRRDTRHTEDVIALSKKALHNRSISQHDLWCLCLGVGLSATLRCNFVLAREMLERLLEIRHQPEFTISGEDRTVGLVALTAGHWDIGFQYLIQALKFHRSRQCWAEYAWNCYDLVAALRCWKVVTPCESVPGGEEYNEEALRREGCETATRLEMEPLLERYRLIDSAPDDPTAWQWEPAVGLMSGPTEDRKQRQNQEKFAALSSRESEVLTHVAAGKTNQEIGRDLYISEHTVANHVRRILKKLGLTNRIDAATYAVRHGLSNADNSFSSDK